MFVSVALPCVRGLWRESTGTALITSIPPAKSRDQPKASPSPVVLPVELIAEILSFSAWKPSCTSGTWASPGTPSSPTPLSRKCTSRNQHETLTSPHLTLLWTLRNDCSITMRRVGHSDGCDTTLALVPFPMHRLLENPMIIVAVDNYCRGFKERDAYWVAGSCDGLVCLFGCSAYDEYSEYWLYFWHPTTRTRSKDLGYFLDSLLSGVFKFSSGYAHSTV